MLGTLVKDAGTTFDLCNDIVSNMGCCFQSYRQYMLLGTAASVTAMNDAQAECTKDGISGLDLMCPCAKNDHAFANTTFCSRTCQASFDPPSYANFHPSAQMRLEPTPVSCPQP